MRIGRFRITKSESFDACANNGMRQRFAGVLHFLRGSEMKRTYRQFLVMVAEEFVMQSFEFLSTPKHYQQDYRNAVQWLKDLPEELCPEVTDEQLSQAKED